MVVFHAVSVCWKTGKVFMLKKQKQKEKETTNKTFQVFSLVWSFCVVVVLKILWKIRERK